MRRAPRARTGRRDRSILERNAPASSRRCTVSESYPIKRAPGRDSGRGFRASELVEALRDQGNGQAKNPEMPQARRGWDDARGAAKVRAALQATPDSAWKENWKLSFQGKTIFEGDRFLAYREMFLNHLVHHRAQLGVYLRLNDKPVPATYGPSADDKMGF